MGDVVDGVGLDDGRLECNQWVEELQDGLNFQPLIDFLERLKEPLPQPPAVDGESWPA